MAVSMERLSSEAAHRSDYIINRVLRDGYVSVLELAAALFVSPATIRRDLQALSVRGLVRRTHGGAVDAVPLTRDLTQFYLARESTNRAEKNAIGNLAATLVQPGETIALSGGSTTRQLALQIRTINDLSVVTNDLSIVRILSETGNAQIFVPGGHLNLGKDNLTGQTAVDAVQHLVISKAFLGVTAVDMAHGATAGHAGNVVFLRALVDRSHHCVVLADHTKFLLPPTLTICPVDHIDVLVTNDGASPGTLDEFRAVGVRVLVASTQLSA